MEGLIRTGRWKLDKGPPVYPFSTYTWLCLGYPKIAILNGGKSWDFHLRRVPPPELAIKTSRYGFERRPWPEVGVGCHGGFSLSDMGGPNMGYAAKLQFPWGYLQEKLLMYFVVIDVWDHVLSDIQLNLVCAPFVLACISWDHPVCEEASILHRLAHVSFKK